MFKGNLGLVLNFWLLDNQMLETTQSPVSLGKEENGMRQPSQAGTFIIKTPVKTGGVNK